MSKRMPTVLGNPWNDDAKAKIMDSCRIFPGEFGSFFDPMTRFFSLPADILDWAEQVAESNSLLPATKDNLKKARIVASILPIRLRWYKRDRFGKCYLKAKVSDADYFAITCRLRETQRSTK
jgi:hypothetical protein